MRLVTFASGSGGNCALLSDGDTHLLIDAGMSMKRIRLALQRQGLLPEELSGILITHEHNDHISGLPMMVKHYGTPIIAPRTVANHLRWSVAGVDSRLREIVPDEVMSLGGVSVSAFPTPHDTDQSVGYRVEGGCAVGFCTDCGHVTEDMRRGLTGCTLVVLEANHDPEMLRYGPYPVSLKRRILSERGHLSNSDCAAFSRELAGGGLRSLILGHLSRENNRPALAWDTVRAALDAAGYVHVRLEVAPPDRDLVVDAPEEESACLA